MRDLLKKLFVLSNIEKANEIKQELQSLKKSKLTDDEKSKALKSHEKFTLTTTIFTIITFIFMGIVVMYGFSLNNDFGFLIVLIAMILTSVIFIIYILFGKKLFPDWFKYNHLVDMGFDGLSKEEISILKPNASEEERIKKYVIREWILGGILIIFIAVLTYICIKLKISVYTAIVIIPASILLIVWYVMLDNCEVEIHRIRSGYYKKKNFQGQEKKDIDNN